MKNARTIFMDVLLIAFLTTATTAFAEDDNLAIPQVAGQDNVKVENNKADTALLKNAHNDASKKDYQKQILSNPKISDIGRASTLTSGGGNTATVVQQSAANHYNGKHTANDNHSIQNGDKSTATDFQN